MGSFERTEESFSSIYSMALQTKHKRVKRHIDYKVVPLQAEHVEAAKDILVDAFTGRIEPMCSGASPFEFRLLMQIVMDISLVYNTSSVAIEKKTNKVIGTVIFNEMLFWTDYSLIKYTPIWIVRIIQLILNRHWDIILTFFIFVIVLICKSYFVLTLIPDEIYYVGFPVLTAMIFLRLSPKKDEDIRHSIMRLIHPEIVDELLENWINERKQKKEWKRGVILECFLSGVHSDYVRCGVGTALKKNMIRIAKENGFKYIVSEATNDYSQGQNKKIGFKIKKEIFYDSYECPKKSGMFPWRFVSKETGFKKLCLMVYICQ